MFNYSFLILLSSLLIRLFILLNLPIIEIEATIANKAPARVPIEHFFEFLYNNIVIPPMSHILNGGISFIFGPQNANKFNLCLALIFILDSFSAWLVFKTMLLFKISKNISFIISLIFSIGLISFEIWSSLNGAVHYDHHSILFITLFFYFFVKASKLPSIRNGLYLGVSSSLMIFQMSIASYILLPLLFFSYCINRQLYPKLHHQSLRYLAFLFVLPILSISLLFLRNWLVSGIIASSPKGGAALMMFVQSSIQKNISYPTQAEENLLKQMIYEAKAPEWYIWCFDHYKNPLKPSDPSFLGWNYLARSFGVCMPTSEDPGESPWPYDFDPLIKKLEEFKAADVLHYVRQDRYDSYNRKYIFNAHVVALSPRWIGIYGAISLKVAKRFLFSHPWMYIQGIIMHHQNIYWGHGPDFATRVLEDLKQVKTFPLDSFLLKFNKKIFSKIQRISYIFLPLITLLFIICYLLIHEFINPVIAYQKLCDYLLCFAPVFIISLMFSSTVSQENDRYFIQICTFLLVGFGLLIRDLFQFLRFLGKNFK